MLIAPLCAQRVYATEDVGVEGEKWHYSLIYSEEVPSTPNVVIIYLHGDNSTGTKVFLYIFVGNNRNDTVYNRQYQIFTD